MINKAPLKIGLIGAGGIAQTYCEALRNLRSALSISNVDAPPRVIVLTSALPAEGKTTIALSLGRVAANLTVVGHTDTVGPAALNARLAVRRATVVQEILVGRGISAGSIEATSYGESLLLVPTADNVDEPRNRRVEVIVR